MGTTAAHCIRIYLSSQAINQLTFMIFSQVSRKEYRGWASNQNYAEPQQAPTKYRTSSKSKLHQQGSFNSKATQPRFREVYELGRSLGPAQFSWCNAVNSERLTTIEFGWDLLIQPFRPKICQGLVGLTQQVGPTTLRYRNPFLTTCISQFQSLAP